MTTRFQIKRSTVSGVVPTTSNIANGELAVNLADSKLFTSNGSAVLELGSNLTNLSVTGNVTLRGVVANGSLGTSGHVLHSNGTSTYWAVDDQGVTSVATGNGLTGGTITTTGTVSILANSGITANSTGTFVTQGTGTVVNATGVHVNSTYIGTLTANNATNLNGQPASYYTNATNLSAGTVPTARLGSGTANSTTFLSGDQSYKTAITSVATGSGLTGGVITTTGTVSILANSGVTANAAGLFVTQGTGLTVNATGVHVNSSYIGTLTANNANNLNGQPASYYTNATNITTGTLATARLPATANISTAVNVGANVNLSTSQISVGNSTVNVVINSTSISVTSDPLVQQSDVGTAPNQIPLNQYLGSLAYQSDAVAVSNVFAVGNAGYFVANGNVGIGNSAPAHRLRVDGDISISGGIHANGSLGTSGHVLHSNGTSTYWAADDQGVTSVATGNGLTGGTITSTGTVSVLANSGIIANATGIHVNANNGVVANATGLFVRPGTGVTVNATGVHIGQDVGTNSAVSFQSVAVANTLTTNAINANGSFGTNGQVLTSDGSKAYWSTPLQEIAGITAEALHRSPNAITAMHIYDTSKDSDGGAWTERCQHTSWWNETIYGKWLGAQDSERNARFHGATLGANLGDPYASVSGYIVSSGTAPTISAGWLAFNPGVGFAWASKDFTTVAGRTYRLTGTFRRSASNAIIFAGTGSGAATHGSSTLSASGAFVFYFTATGTTSNVGVQSQSGTLIEFQLGALVEVTALNTTSGDYFQLSTDGKFYRLWKNWVGLSEGLLASFYYVQDVTQATTSISGFENSLFYGDNSTTRIAYKFVSAPAILAGQSETYSFYIQMDDGLAPTTDDFDVIVRGSGGIDGIVITAVAPPLYRVSRTRTYASGTSAAGVVYGPRKSTTNSARSFRISGHQVEFGAEATAYEAKTTDNVITEVFRGNKRDFPRLAAIVGEASNITIYDLTEQGRPMFARFIATATGTLSAKNMLSGANALAAMNGRLAVGGSGSNLTGLTLIDFVRDTAELRQTSGYTWSLGGIAMRNSTGGYVTVDANVGGLGNATVRDVSMAVLPDAPVDPVSGLRVPTIALASNYISIIQDEGVVRNSALASAFFSVVLTPSILYAGAADRQELLFVTNPGSVGANFSLASRQGTQAPGFGPALVEKLKGFARTTLLRTNTNRQLFQLACVNESDIGRSIVANLNYALNSGWMTGDIRRCYLTETTAGTITGPAPELVVNGTFDTDLSGWTIYQSTSWVDGAMRIASNGGADPNCFSSPFVVKPGSVYEMTFTLFGSDAVNRQAYVRFSTSGFAVNAIAPFDTGGVVTVSPGTTTITTTKTIVPSGVTSMTVSVSLSVGVGNPTAKVDLLSVSVKEVVPSLTTHARGAANINGTLTKTQLASGTSLVGYSGFSAVNYLRESYSADLDFGTGEWTASAWVNVPDSANLGGNLLRNDTIGTQTGSTRITATGPTGISESVGQFGDGITSFFSYSSIPNLQAPVNGRRTTVSLWVKIVSDTSGTSGSVDFYHYAGPPGPLITFSAASQGVGNWFQISRTGVNAGTDNQFRISVPAGMIIQVTRLLLQYGSTVGTFVDGGASQVILRNNVTDRAGASGAFYRLYIDSTGCLGAQAYDGTTTRTVTTTSAYNTGQWIKASVNYTTDGTLALWVNGREVATARGTPLLSLSSRYNLLTWTEQFNNAAWNKDLGGFSIATGASDPLGGNTAITLTASANGSRIWQVATNSGSGNYTASIWIRRRSGSGNINWEASQVGVGSLITVTSEWQKVTFNGIHNVSDYYFGLRVATAGDSIDIAFADLRKSIYDGLPYQRVTSVAETEVAPLTIGNSYALDAPFPGSLALLKLGATVPTAEQEAFMYEQEKQLFRSNAMCVLPDSSAIVDMAFDDATDRWVAVSASNESYWTGLVRNSVTPVPTGSFTRVAAGSGVELAARSTTNPGVDVTIPAYGLREELVKRAEAAARLSKELTIYDYVGGFQANTTSGSTAIATNVSTITYPASLISARISGSGIPSNTTITSVSGNTIYLSAAATANATNVSISFLDFKLPVGLEAKSVMTGGSLRREGATQDYTRLYDGFVETIRFAVAPGATAWVQIQATKGTT